MTTSEGREEKKKVELIVDLEQINERIVLSLVGISTSRNLLELITDYLEGFLKIRNQRDPSK